MFSRGLPTFGALVAIVIAPIASGGSFTVDDDDPGADFAQVVDALSSPLVQDGDVLLVQPGQYLPFQIDGRSIVVVGQGSNPLDVVFSTPPGLNRVDNLGPGQHVALANVSFGTLYASSSHGVITLQGVEGSLDLTNVSDCRVEGSSFRAIFAWGVTLRSSRASLSSCDIAGVDGIAAVFVDDQSAVTIASSNARGGDGEDASGFFTQGGDGGPGIILHGVATLLGPSSSIEGGNGGYGADIPEDGLGGPAILLQPGGVVRHSRTDLVPGTTPCTGIPADIIEDGGGTVLTPTPPLVATVLSGAPFAGQTLDITAHAWDGAFVAPFAGLAFESVQLAGVTGVLCTNVGVFLGSQVLVGTTSLSLSVPLAPGIPPGTVAFTQSVAIDAMTSRLSNCVPVVIR